jgi:hypothetical protein
MEIVCVTLHRLVRFQSQLYSHTFYPINYLLVVGSSVDGYQVISRTSYVIRSLINSQIVIEVSFEMPEKKKFLFFLIKLFPLRKFQCNMVFCYLNFQCYLIRNKTVFEW